MWGSRRFRQVRALASARRRCPGRAGTRPRLPSPDGQGEPPLALATPEAPQRCASCTFTQTGGGGACQRCGRPFPDPASELLQRLQARGVNFFLGEYDFRYQTSSEDLRQAVEGNRDAILRALRRDAKAAAYLSLEDPIKPFLSPAGCMALAGILYLCAVAALWLWSRWA